MAVRNIFLRAVSIRASAVSLYAFQKSGAKLTCFDPPGLGGGCRGCDFSAFGLKGSTDCRICHISYIVGGKHGGVPSVCILSMGKVGVGGFVDVCVCGEGGVQGCCVDLLSQSGLRVADLKPY